MIETAFDKTCDRLKVLEKKVEKLIAERNEAREVVRQIYSNVGTVVGNKLAIPVLEATKNLPWVKE